MMLFGGLTAFLSDTLEIPLGTVGDRLKALRHAGMLTVGTQGPGRGARMDSGDAVNGLLACILEHRRGESVADNVQRACSLLVQRDIPLELPRGFTAPLGFFGLRRFGPSLAEMLDTMRSGQFATWAAGEPYSLTVAIEARGMSGYVALNKEAISEYNLRIANASYGKLPPEHQRRVSRSTTISGSVFNELAEALGPPE